MTERTIILDYAAAEHRRWRSTQLFLRILRPMRWFVFQRPLNAAEVAFAAWIVWAGLYLFWAARRFELGDSSLNPILSVTELLPGVVVVALARLMMRRRWKTLFVFVLLAAALASLVGMIQYERCPHATYVQILGISIPVEGKPCGNPRKIEPWWMRE